MTETATTAGTGTTASPSVADSQPRVVPAPPPAPPAHPTVVDPSIHERLLRDYKRLKSRLDVLEKENEGLRASLWELSWRYGKNSAKGKGKQKDVDQDEEDLDQEGHLPLELPNPQPPGDVASASGDRTPPTLEQLKVSIPATPISSNVELTPTPTPRTSYRAPAPVQPTGALPPPSNPLTPPSSASFMRLNEPVTTSTPITATSPVPAPSLPITPSSLAASLFSAKPAPQQPSSQSSTSSRTTPALRDASLKRDLDITLPTSRRQDIKERRTWKWGRGYDLKGHRGAVYAMKFSERDLANRGRLLASAGFDGVRVWGPKEGRSSRGSGGGSEKNANKPAGGGDDDDDDEEDDRDEEEGEAWDVGDVDEVVHLTSHTAPVSDIAFSPTMSHLLSGGYDSQVYVTPLSAAGANGADPYRPIWSIASDGLVQSVAWVQHGVEAGDSGNLFAWGTSGKVLSVGDLRMEKPAMVVQTEGMVNTIQSFRRSPHLVVGDSLGQIRQFSLRSGTWVTPPDPNANVSIPTALLPPPPKKATPISCLALNGDWRGKKEPKWVASIGFDNFVRVFDRGVDPLKSHPKQIHTLRGKNRNWPIKASWYQGIDFVDPSSASKRTAASKTRSRSDSFSSNDPNDPSSSTSTRTLIAVGAGSTSRPAHSIRSRSFSARRGGGDVDEGDSDANDSDMNDDDKGSGKKNGKNGKGKGGRGEPVQSPLEQSLLLAAGSAEPVVLVWDMTSGNVASATGGLGGTGSGTGEGSHGGAGGREGPSATGAGGDGHSPNLFQRLEGHKDSVYAVDFLQRNSLFDDDVAGVGIEGNAGYRGHGLLASAGADCVVKIWKPVFQDVE
ncbi:WD40 repeat-like protein [Meredithblackwellia eburnea MCA 4105]